MRELVQGGANVNQVSAADDMSALTSAIINGNFDMAKFLVDHGGRSEPGEQDRPGPALCDHRWTMGGPHVVSATECFRGEKPTIWI